MDHILYQIFRITYILKKHGEKTVNTSIRICKSKIENRIKFKIKVEHYLELSTLGTMKLLARTKSKIAKDKYGENVPYLEIKSRINTWKCY